jgi:hypothetical protein
VDNQGFAKPVDAGQTQQGPFRYVGGPATVGPDGRWQIVIQGAAADKRGLSISAALLPGEQAGTPANPPQNSGSMPPLTKAASVTPTQSGAPPRPGAPRPGEPAVRVVDRLSRTGPAGATLLTEPVSTPPQR